MTYYKRAKFHRESFNTLPPPQGSETQKSQGRIGLTVLHERNIRIVTLEEHGTSSKAAYHELRQHVDG